MMYRFKNIANEFMMVSCYLYSELEPLSVWTSVLFLSLFPSCAPVRCANLFLVRWISYSEGNLSWICDF